MSEHYTYLVKSKTISSPSGNIKKSEWNWSWNILMGTVRPRTCLEWYTMSVMSFRIPAGNDFKASDTFKIIFFKSIQCMIN